MLSMLLMTNLIIAGCYYVIAGLVGLSLWQARARGFNALGMSTAGIFLTCALGHSVHLIEYTSMAVRAVPGLSLSQSFASVALTAGAATRFVCSVVPGLSSVTGFPPPVSTNLIDSGIPWWQLLVDLSTVVPAVGFLAMRSRYGLLVDGEGVILDYQRTIQVERARVAERTAALEVSEERARELAEARAAAEQAAQALRSSESRFRLLAENARDLIYRYRLGPAPGFDYVSPAVWPILGYTPEQWYANPQIIREIAHPDDIDQISAALRDPRQIVNPLITRWRHASGATVWIEHQLSVAAGPDGLLVEGFGRDITERVTSAAAQREFERKMQDAQKLESIGVLAGGVAHDFNNILAGILGYAELAVLEATPGSPLHSSLQAINTSARRAAELTNQLLAYAGKGRFVIEPVQINSLIRDMAELVRASLGKSVALHYDLAEHLPPIDADAAQIQQVVLNLIVNASEAIEQHGRIDIATTVETLCPPLAQTLVIGDNLAPGRYICLTVRDTGHGMDEPTMQRIFEPFFTTKFTGRGLGLAAVQGIVRGHRGALAIESAPGRGTTFQVWFPAGAAPPVAELAAPEPASAGSGTVLVIDDEETVRTVIGRMLERMGFQVEVFADGATALAWARQTQQRVRFVLLDLTMPHMSGDEVALRLHKLLPNTPVMLMSGYSTAETTLRYEDHGLAGFLQKPFTFQSLRTLVEQVLHAAQPAAQPGAAKRSLV